MKKKDISDKAVLTIRGKEYEFPIVEDCFGNVAVEITARFFDDTKILLLNPGYRSTAAVRSGITYIDGEKGVLLYRGYPIEQIAKKGTFLETAYLLLHGELPRKNQLENFESEIIRRMPVHDQLHEILRKHTRHAHPMPLIGSLVTALGTLSPEVDLRETEGRYEVALDLIAKMPTIVAAAFRYTNGKPRVEPRKDLGYAENFLRMCFTPSDAADYPIDPVVARAMDRVLILHADHEQNASTATVRTAGSTRVEPYAAISTGIAALWGSAHGGANEEVVKQLEKIKSVDDIPGLIQRATAEGKDKIRLSGFGHGVYRVRDPRVPMMFGACHEVINHLGKESSFLAVAMELERQALANDYFKEKNLYPNFDFYSGIFFKTVDFKKREFTPIFALGRMPGWIAQWKEMSDEPQMMLVRPRQLYTGPRERKYVPIDSRPS